MKRLVYLLPTVCMGLALTACPGGDDGTAVTATEGDTEDEDDDTTSGPSTVTTPTVSETTPSTTGETDPPTTDQPTTTEPETEATTEPPMCTKEDECMVPEDCPIPGADCVACFCAGGEGCPMYGEGTFGDCLTGGTAACMGSTGAACVVDNVTNPTAGVCYSTCEEACDCPAPPKGFEAQLTCGGLVDAEGNCYITCENGESCPDGWQCVGNFFCAIGEAVVLDGWADCANLGGTCPETDSGGGGFCLNVDAPEDGSTGPGGVCSAQPCTDADDCADAPATGDSVVTCADVTGRGMNDCFLDCSGGETCPDDMVCHADFGVCYWELNVLDPYAECVESGGTCPDGPNGGAQNCLSDMMDTLSVCTNACGDVDDCPPEPTETGDAPVACIDIAGGMFCVLDCADGQTCPDGMECQLDICVNPIGA